MPPLDDAEIEPFGSWTGVTAAFPAPAGATRTFDRPFEANARWQSEEWPTTFWRSGREIELGPDLPHIFGPVSRRLGPFLTSRCKYCGGDLRLYNEVAMPNNQQWRRADAVQCDRCLWWLYVWTKVQYTDFALHCKIREAAVHSFDYRHAEAPLGELRAKIAKDEIDLRTIDPTALERLVASVFRDHLGASVRHIGGSGDDGVDIYVLDGEPPLAIQVKRRANARAEGPAVVRELIGALAYRGWRRGAIVTTATQFSEQAKRTTQGPELRRDGYVIDLYALDALRELVRATAPPPLPWRQFVPTHYPLPDVD